MTNQELYETISKSGKITTGVTDVLLELDSTASVTTQAELNKLLCELYQRMETEDITIDAISETAPATKEQFLHWIDDTFDSYSADLLKQSI